jgi:hypothetical protein
LEELDEEEVWFGRAPPVELAVGEGLLVGDLTALASGDDIVPMRRELEPGEDMGEPNE